MAVSSETTMFRKKPPPPTLPPEWLIVGLGNPGPEYSGSRHNVGFDFVDALAQAHKVILKVRKHRAVYGVGEIDGTPVVLAKPMTFMNLSGQAVILLMREFGINPERVLVVTDDLDLPVGKVRMRSKGSAGGHNGHKSIIQSLGTTEYPRIKVGIGKTEDGETVDHVLSKFHPDERADIDAARKLALRMIEATVSDGLEMAMTRFNGS